MLTDGVRAQLMEWLTSSFYEARWSIPSDFLSKSHFVRVVAGLDWTSSPGYPYMRNATNNGILLGVVDGVPNPDRLDWLWSVVQSQLLLRRSDPIRLFVKAEPHKKSKLEDSRHRLISSVSIVDQVIDHMIFGDFNQAVVDNWATTPSKVGWSAYRGGYRAIPDQVWLALDKSSWDWTVNVWLVELVLQARVNLCTNFNDYWYELACWRYKELFFNAVFVTSGGTMLRQVNPGVMKSGCVNTIVDNTLMQIILHLRVCIETGQEPGLIYAMGDDTLQERPIDYQAYIDKMGEYSIVKDGRMANEFAGLRFHGKRIEPLYAGKHAFNLLHADPDNEEALFLSYLLLYHRSSRRQIIVDIMQLMGLRVPTWSWCEMIYDQ